MMKRTGVRRNNAFAEWAKKCAGDLSLRQIANRTGIAHTTITAFLEGRVASPGTIIRFAAGFGQDVPTALDLAGFDDIAELWRTGASPIALEAQSQQSAKKPQVLRWYEGLPPTDRKAAETMLKSLYEKYNKPGEEDEE